jgi:hypothetical protein
MKKFKVSKEFLRKVIPGCSTSDLHSCKKCEVQAECDKLLDIGILSRTFIKDEYYKENLKCPIQTLKEKDPTVKIIKVFIGKDEKTVPCGNPTPVKNEKIVPLGKAMKEPNKKEKLNV